MITSVQNEQIKHLLWLRKKPARYSSEEILIDGEKPLLRALEAGLQIKKIYFSGIASEDPFYNKLAGLNLPLVEVSKKAFQKISYGEIQNGFITIATPLKPTSFEKNLQKDGMFVVLENVEKPGNIGAVLRTCDAVGCSAVYVCDSQTGLLNPNIIRASMGTCFSLPYIESNPLELKTSIDENKVCCIALSPGGTTNYLDIDYTRPVAIFAGNEHHGLSDFWLKRATPVFIPMKGQADSLNVSVSLSIVLFEAYRQRRTKFGTGYY